MKPLFTFFTFFITTFCLAQSGTQLIITSLEKSNITKTEGKKLYLQNKARKNEVVFTYNPSTNTFSTEKYLDEHYSSIWDGKKHSDEKTTTDYKTYKKSFSAIYFDSLKKALDTDLDTSEIIVVSRSSHHTVKLWISIIENGDTIEYIKTEPFDEKSNWRGDKNVLNRQIDGILFNLLPVDFLERDKLDLSAKALEKRRKDKRPWE